MKAIIKAVDAGNFIVRIDTDGELVFEDCNTGKHPTREEMMELAGGIVLLASTMHDGSEGDNHE